MKLSITIFRGLLWFYPQKFRQAYQDDMVQVFRDCWRDAQQAGRWGIVRLWSHTLSDLLITALQEWVLQLIEKDKPMNNSFDRQLGNSIQSMSILLRAGYSLLQAMQMIADKSPEPIARSFGGFVDDLKSGKGIDDALTHLEESADSAYLTQMVETMRQQRQRESNLALDLEPVAQNIRNGVGDDETTKTILQEFTEMTRSQN